MMSLPNMLPHLLLPRLLQPPLSQTHLVIHLQAHRYPSKYTVAQIHPKRQELMMLGLNVRKSAHIMTLTVTPTSRMAATAPPSLREWGGDHARGIRYPEVSTYHQPSNRQLFTHNHSATSSALQLLHRGSQSSILQTHCLHSWQCKPCFLT